LALMKLMASSAICSIEFAGEPLLEPMPRLLNAITWCLAAMPSMIRGSQLSRTAAPLVQQSYLNRPGAVHPSTLPVVPNAGIFENTSVMKSMNTMARFESSLLAT